MNKRFFQLITGTIVFTSIPVLTLIDYNNKLAQPRLNNQITASPMVAGIFDGIQEAVDEVNENTQEVNQTTEDVNNTGKEVNDTASDVNDLLNGLDGSEDNSQPLDGDFTDVEAEE